MGLPNTRNILKSWSISHLNGIDITELGPPGRGRTTKEKSDDLKLRSSNSILNEHNIGTIRNGSIKQSETLSLMKDNSETTETKIEDLQ